MNHPETIHDIAVAVTFLALAAFFGYMFTAAAITKGYRRPCKPRHFNTPHDKMLHRFIDLWKHDTGWY